MGEEECTNRCRVQEEEEEEEEEEINDDNDEALSLSDLPVLNNGNKPEIPTTTASTPTKSSSEPPEFFEFFSSLTSEMTSAEDIIFSGKLIPFREHSPPIRLQTIDRPHNSKGDRKLISSHRRSGSFSGFQSYVNRSSSTKAGLMRNSRSLNYQRLRRFSGSRNSWDSDMELSSSVNGTGKGDAVGKKTARPGWFVLMFGMVKPPAEMELRDIKIRQFRRNVHSTVFPPPPVDGRGKIQGNSSSGKGSCWLLKVLSCKDHTSVAVTTAYSVHPV